MILIAIILCGLNISRQDCNLIDPRIVTLEVEEKAYNVYNQAFLNSFAGMPDGTELFVGKGVKPSEVLSAAKDKAWCMTDLKSFKTGVTRLVLQKNKFTFPAEKALATPKVEYIEPSYQIYQDCPSCRRYR